MGTVIVYKQTEINGVIPIRVTYTCQNCGHKNIDKNQVIRIQGTSALRTVLDKEGMKEEAYKDYIENAKRHIKDIKNNKFFSAALKCRCESCSKKPLWASYPGYSLYTIAVFLGIFGALGIALFCIFKESPLWYLVGGIIGLLPIIALIVYNIITKNRIKSMPKEFLPEIEMDAIFESLVEEDEESSKTDDKPKHQTAEWTCPACGRVNQSYVGTCGCGVTKTEAQKSNKG